MNREFDVPRESHADSAFETDLSQLTPLASGLDRDRLMYRLGQLSARKNAPSVPWIWPTVAAGLFLTTVWLGIAVVRKPEGRVMEKLVQVEKFVTPPSNSMMPKVSESELARNAVVDNGHRSRDPWSWTLASGKPLRADSYLERRSEAEVLSAILATYPSADSSTKKSTADSLSAAALRVGDRSAWKSLLLDQPSARDLEEF